MKKSTVKKTASMKKKLDDRRFAESLVYEIKLAEWLSHKAFNIRSRVNAYRLKHKKISNAITRFNSKIYLHKVEIHPRKGVLLRLNLCGVAFVATLSALNDDVRKALMPLVETKTSLPLAA